MKLNPQSFSRPPSDKRTVSLVLGGDTHEFQVKRLSDSEVMHISEVGDEIAFAYLGMGKPGKKGYTAPEKQLPPVGGMPAIVSRRHCQIAAAVAYAQTAESASDRYEVVDLLGLMQHQGLVDQVLDIWTWIMGSPGSDEDGDEDDDEGKAQASDTDDSLTG